MVGVSGRNKYDDKNRDGESWFSGVGRLRKNGAPSDFGRQLDERDFAKEALMSVEEEANFSGDDNEMADVDEIENGGHFGFYGNDSEKRRVGEKINRGGGKKRVFGGVLKKKGPMWLILALVGGVGGFMAGAQSTMPFAIEEMIIEKFNSIGVSSTMASDAWLNTQLNYGVRMENLQTGETGNLFAFSQYQVEQFEKQGIKVINDVGGTTTGNIMTLLYKKGSEYIPVVGSDILQYNGYTERDLINAIKNASGLSNIGKPVSAEVALSDAAFKVPYTAASKVWRGGASGWFDKVMSSVTEAKLSIRRNRWARYIAGELKDANERLMAFNETASSSAAMNGTVDDGVETNSVFYVDEEGNQYSADMVTVDDDGQYKVGDVAVTLDETSFGNDELGGIQNWAHGVLESESFQKISSILNSKAMKVGTKVATYGCAIIEGMATIYTVAAAYQSLQYLNLITGFLEAVDKIKAGDANGSPVHEYSTNLITVGETVDSNSGEERRVVANKTAMQSAGMANLFTGALISGSDVSVQNVNFESLMANLSVLTSNVQLMEETYEMCGYAKIATAGVSLVTTIISLIPIVGGAVKVAEVSAKEIIKAGIKALAGMAFQILVPIAARKIASLLIKNAATEWFGEDLGNALVSGANKYLGGNGTSGGQSGASMKKLLAYKIEQEAVIADEAEYQRSIRSPFDLTSRYTFLGSLAYAVMPLAYSGGGVMSAVRNMSSLTTSSLVAMSPAANAIAAQNELDSVGDCPLLNSTGAVGDAFCNPYVVTDTSTMGIAPEEISYIVHNLNAENNEIAAIDGVSRIDSSNFNDDGTIKDNSNLAKYSIFCGQRTSPLGLKDATIADQVTGQDNTIVKIIGFVPGLNDLSDIVTGSIGIANMSWMTGESCVADENNSSWENEYRYYQRYMENERLLENMNPGYKSPVTELAERYYKKNPVDNSMEGQLARFSGMSKEDVSDALALIEYYQFLAQYDISERYAFGTPSAKTSSRLLFDNNNKIAEKVYIITLNNILYADVRNRSFAV